MMGHGMRGMGRGLVLLSLRLWRKEAERIQSRDDEGTTRATNNDQVRMSYGGGSWCHVEQVVSNFTVSRLPRVLMIKKRLHFLIRSPSVRVYRAEHVHMRCEDVVEL